MSLRTHFVLLALGCSFFVHVTLHAQIRDWGGTTGNWHFDANWVQGNAPNTASETAVIGGSTPLSILMDFNNGRFSFTIADLVMSNPSARLIIGPENAGRGLFINDGFTNHGRITLGQAAGVPDAHEASLFVDGTIINQGTLELRQGNLSDPNDLSLVRADILNHGIVSISHGRTDRTGGVYTNHNGWWINTVSGRYELFGGTFNQEAGTIINLGVFDAESTVFNFNGGNIAQNAIDLHASSLNIGAGSTGEAEFNFSGSNPMTTFTGHLAAAQTINIIPRGSSSLMRALNDFTNDGNINLNSDLDFQDVSLVRDGTITNSETGTISFGGTSVHASTDRTLAADLINNGTVHVNQNTNFVRTGGFVTNNADINIATGKVLKFRMPTFNQNGGTITNDGTFDFSSTVFNFNDGNIVGNAVDMVGSTLNIGTGSVGTGEFNLAGFNANTQLNGDVAAAQTINIVPTSVSTLVHSTADFTNFGTINLKTDSSFGNVTLQRVGRITNAGTIAFNGTAIANVTRLLDTELHNASAGTVDIEAEGVDTRIGRAGNHHLNEGMIVSRNSNNVVTIFGSSFTNAAGGILAGLGEYDFTSSGLNNNGIISPGLSAGELVLDGDVVFGASSVLQIELGGLIQGAEYDHLSVLDNLTLDGALSVSFTNSFQSLIDSNDTFTILSAGNLSGNFAGLAQGATIETVDGLAQFTINYSGNSVQLGNFTAIPEPSVLFTLSLLCLCGLTRRRRG